MYVAVGSEYDIIVGGDAADSETRGSDDISFSPGVLAVVLESQDLGDAVRILALSFVGEDDIILRAQKKLPGGVAVIIAEDAADRSLSFRQDILPEVGIS